MTTIGYVQKQSDGRYTGNLSTLMVQTRIRIEPVEKKNGDKSPDFRVFGGTSKIDVGAAWIRVGRSGSEYVALKLDDPSFPAPIYATLAEVDGEEGLQLIWSRPNRD